MALGFSACLTASSGAFFVDFVDFLLGFSLISTGVMGISLIGGPTPTRMSPAVMDGGAKGPTRKEMESQRRIDLRGSELKCSTARVQMRREKETEMKRVGLWRDGREEEEEG